MIYWTRDNKANKMSPGNLKHFKTSEKPRLDEGGNQALGPRDGKSPLDCQPIYTGTEVPYLPSTSISREFQTAQRNSPGYKVTMETSSSTHGSNDANAMNQWQYLGSKFRNLRRSQQQPSDVPKTMPRQVPLLLGNSARPTTPTRANKRLRTPQSKLGKQQESFNPAYM